MQETNITSYVIRDPQRLYAGPLNMFKGEDIVHGGMKILSNLYK